MKQYEKIKKEIIKCDSSMEMAGFLNGLDSAAIVYCQQNCPDEIWLTESGKNEISIYGIQQFLESEVQAN